MCWLVHFINAVGHTSLLTLDPCCPLVFLLDLLGSREVNKADPCPDIRSPPQPQVLSADEIFHSPADRVGGSTVSLL